MTIHRYTKRDRDNLDEMWCVECERNQRNGFWLFDTANIGPAAIFVCDECLTNAKKSKFFTFNRDKLEPPGEDQNSR
jgi:hypothetical protein